MQTSAKIALSMPRTTFRRLERARRRLRRSRSAAVTEAVEAWLRIHELGPDDRRYVEGYLRKPERTEAVGSVASAAVARWEPWE